MVLQIGYLLLGTEVWHKSENKKHQFKIEELLELKGLKYISTPRPGTRRGGGAALVVNTENFSISKLNTSIPNILTVVLTDLEVFLEEPIIVKPIDADDPLKGGVPSDHNGVIVIPRSVSDVPVKRQKISRIIRPITSSNIDNIGQVFTKENWEFMNPDLSSSQLTDLFQYLLEKCWTLFVHRNRYSPDQMIIPSLLKI